MELKTQHHHYKLLEILYDRTVPFIFSCNQGFSVASRKATNNTLHPCKLPVCSFRKRALFSFRVSWGTNFITPVSYKCHWDPAWPQFCTGAAFLHTERLTVQRLNSGVKKAVSVPWPLLRFLWSKLAPSHPHEMALWINCYINKYMCICFS